MAGNLIQQTLRFVLDGLRYPAQRWEIVVQADLYGANASTCEQLRQLPTRPGPYQNLQDIVAALESIPRPRD